MTEAMTQKQLSLDIGRMNLDFDILELYFVKKSIVMCMFKIRFIFLDLSTVYKKTPVSELISFLN